MNLYTRILGLSLVSLLGVTACSDSEKSAPCADAAVSGSALGLVHGRVTDDKGVGVKDVDVGTAEAKVRTRADGSFELAVPADKDLIVSVENDELSRAATLVRVDESGVANVELEVDKLSTVSIEDAKAGGRFEGKDGFAVVLPKESLETAEGKTAEGKAEIRYVALKNPEEIKSAPGDMRVAGEGKTQRVAVSAVGEVRFYQEGKRLNFKGKSADLELPLASTSKDAEGKQLDRFSFDEKSGEWKREGSAKVEEGRVVAKVEHFSWWAAGEVVEDTSCVSATLLDPSGNPASFTRLTAVAVDALLIASADTDEQGEVCLPLAPKHEYAVSAFFGSGEVAGQWQGSVTTSSKAGSCGGSACTELGEVRLEALDPIVEPMTDGGMTEPPTDAGTPDLFAGLTDELDDSKTTGAASLSFDAVEGQRIAFSVERKTGVDGEIQLLAPSGTDVSPVYSTASGVQITDAIRLEETGTYRLQVGGLENGVGTYAVEIWGVPEDATKPIEVDGAKVTVKTTERNQNAVLTFDALGGERLEYRVTSTVGTYTYLTLAAPVSTVDVSGAAWSVAPGSSTNSGVFTLPEEAGTYRLSLDPSQLGIGSLTVELWSVPDDLTKAIKVDGPAVAFKPTVRGQNAVATFSAKGGERLAYSVTSNLAVYTYMTLSSPISDTDVGGASSSVGPNATSYVDVFTLPEEEGIYELLLDPTELGLGTLTVKLWSVPADASAAATPDGATINITTPNQNGRFTFSGTQGGVYTYTITNNTNAYAYLTLVAPSQLEETPNLSSIAGNGTSDTSESFTLGETGTYVLLVDPTAQAVGSFTLSVSQL